MIPEILARCKAEAIAHKTRLETIALILLSASLLLGLIRISWLYSRREPIRIEELGQASLDSAATPETHLTTGTYVASKAGKRYYLLSCGGAKTIKETNRIYFNSKADAEARGYTPAANCKGI